MPRTRDAAPRRAGAEPTADPEESGRTPPPVGRTDVAIAAGAGLVAVAALVALPALAGIDPEVDATGPGLGDRAWWLGVAVLCVQAVALVWRRRRPGAVLVVAAVGVPLAALVGLGDAGGTTSVAVLVAAYSVAVRGPLRRGAPALLAAVGLVGVGTLLVLPDDGASWPVTLGLALLQGVTTVGVAALTGVVVGSRRDAAEARARQVSALRREHEARVQTAVARERTAMARELHDIAAHHLSGIAVMAGAIGRQIDTDPEAAKQAVARVRGETTTMLTELRTLVRLLRDTPEEDGEVRVETLASVPALVERVRASGVDATLTVLADPDGRLPVDLVGPLAQLSAYRTVQESLANVVRHAPGAGCEVVLDARDPATVVVRVRNGPPRARAGPALGPGGGLGLVGMQERADLTDARLTYGRQADGGWLVTLELPAGGAVPPPPGAPPTEGTTA